MIFTIGDKAEYDRDITEKAAKGERLLKAGVSAYGRRKTAGGACWQTLGEAQLWLRDELVREQAAVEGSTEPHEREGHLQALEALGKLSIYGLEAEWERDTIQHDGERFARLIIPRPVCLLDEVGNKREVQP